MHLFTVVGYAYEAALHCHACTRARFPRLKNAQDREGNPVHPVFVSDCEQTEHCDDCHEPIYEVED